jgi:3-hydroxybutyryl-CoA dehydrogenase
VKQTRTESKERILIVGEPALTDEFAHLCAAKGRTVLIKGNRSTSIQVRNHPSVHLVRGIPRTVSLAVELTNTDLETKRANLRTLDRALPPTVPLLSTSVTVSLFEQATWANHKRRLIGFAALPTLIQSNLLELAISPYTSEESITKTKETLWSLGLELSVVQDRVGMVLPRILCMLVNEAAFAVMEEIASGEVIDTAMKLGMNFPRGPIEWGEKIGFDQVYSVLKAIQNDTGDDRYRAAPLIRQLALTRKFWGEVTPARA